MILIAYSLGSLVTHGYLRARATAEPLTLRLITLGSPLGFPAARELVFGETADTLRMPNGVSGWDNVYDPADILSAPLGSKLPGRDVHDYITTVGSYDPHNFRRYLRDPRTGAALKRALCAFTADCVPQGP